jgi:hypothetical protein
MIPLLNKYEKVTYEHLKPVCDQNGATVFAKVRLKDVLPIDGSGVSAEDYRFSLQAHFDFIVTDRDTRPLFAVEYDGSSHERPQQIVRDNRKNALCERFGLSLLRINSRYLERKFRELNLLTYFVQVWFMSDSFYDAQNKGIVPNDEVFDPTWIASDGHSKKQFPYWLSAGAQIGLQRLCDARRISDPIPSDYVGVDKTGKYRCLSWIGVMPGQYAIVTTGIRSQQFPVLMSDLISQIAICDLYEQVRAILSGNAVATPESRLLFAMKNYEERYDMRSRSTFSRFEDKVSN